MNNTVKNIFGVAAAIVALLGVHVATINSPVLPGNESASVETVNNEKAGEQASDRPVSTLKDLNDEIVRIAEAANPAVVTITTQKTEEVSMVNPFSQFFGFPDQRGNDTREYVRRGLGSGVIVSDEGYILTNNHVIESADKIKVRLYNGKEVDAEMIGTDPETDIAVLKVDVDKIPTVKVGDSNNLKVGSFVLAIGSPLSEDLAHTVSFGIVSAKGRSLTNLTVYGNYIQTDAAINPGNSGGALIDMNGELVGINSAIASRSGGNDGIGFAIPIDLAKRIMDDLIEDGEVSRGYLGMYLAGEVDQTMARALGLDDASGIIVGKLEEGGPADKAGLQEQDVIVSLNGSEIQNWDRFRTQIASFKPGEEITLGVIRDNKERAVKVTLGEQERESLASAPGDNKPMVEKLGFSVTDLNPNLRSQLRLDDNVKGIVVSRISESSNAYNRGLRQGDVIVGVKKADITSVSEFNSELNKAVEAGDKVILLTIFRQGLKQYLAFEL